MRATAALLLAASLLPQSARADEPAPKFRALEVWVEVSEGSVAAWQVEVVSEGETSVVGIERGDTPGFSDPPYYDPAALTGGRLVLAGFSTGRTLGPGRHRVAWIHVREVGQTSYDVRLMVAADRTGETVKAAASIEAGSTP